ncbi:MAG: hypothetical protein IKM29_05485 [Clostridia bacterium]|nr:hypothetical protein [Clostridia bacterium]
MNKKENTARISFAREAEKTEKTVMDVVNGEKNGIAAVACGKCSREEAEAICRALTELIKKFPKGSFLCNGDANGTVRFDLCGDPFFVAGAVELICEKGTFGESL